MRDTDEICALSVFWAASPVRVLGASYVWADYRPGSLDLLWVDPKGSWLQVSWEDFVPFCSDLPDTAYLLFPWETLCQANPIFCSKTCCSPWDNLVETAGISCCFHKYNRSTSPCCHTLTIFISNWLFCMAQAILWCCLSLSVPNMHFAFTVGTCRPTIPIINPLCLRCCV